MPRMYVRPESGNRSGGRYLSEGGSRKSIGIRKTHSDDTNYYDYDAGSQNVVRRTGTNDVRSYNDLGQAFKPFSGPEQTFDVKDKIPDKNKGKDFSGNPFPLSSLKRTIPEFQAGVPVGASILARLGEKKEFDKTGHTQVIDPQLLDKDTQEINNIGKAFEQILPPQVMLGGEKAIKEYMTSDPNFVPAMKPHSIDMEPLKEPVALKKKAASVFKAPAVSKGEQKLPALIERNDYFPNGSRIQDQKDNVYESTGYVTMHHKLGADIYKTLNVLEEFIGPNKGELRHMGQNPGSYHGSFKPAPTNPLRLYLKSKGYKISKIDDLLIKHRLYFRNNDFSLGLLKQMDAMMKVLEPLGEKGDEFERFLKIVPDENRKDIKMPYDLYCKKIINTISQSVKNYKKEVLGKPQEYVRRILLDHENGLQLDKAMKDLGQLEDTKVVSYLLDHQRNIAQAGNELLNALKTATNYSQGTVFTHPELLKYTSEIPPRASDFLKALKRTGDDKRIHQHPEFVEKYSDIIYAVDKILQGPLSKDLEMWHIAAKRANPIPMNEKPVAKAPDIMKAITPSLAASASSPNIALQPSPKRVASVVISDNKGNKSASPAKDGKADGKKGKKKGGGKLPLLTDPDYLKYASTLPQPYDLVRPLGAGEQIRPAPFDDPFLRETQNLAEWSDYASKMKAKLDTLNQIGNTIQDMAIVGTGRPDPEFVALSRRRRRLSDLNDVIQEIPKTNRIARSIEQGTLKAQHDYVQGVGKILTERLKIQSEEANQRVKLDQMAAKSATGLASKALETSLMMMKHQEDLFNMFMQIEKARQDNTWKRIKSIAASFKY